MILIKDGKEPGYGKDTIKYLMLVWWNLDSLSLLSEVLKIIK